MRSSIRAAVAALATLGLVLGVSVPAHAATEPFREDFTRTAAVGQVDSVYPQSWQPYPNGMSGKYFSDDIASVHGGNLDLYFGNGKKGAAGTFGTADGAWGHVGGSFSIRAKQVGGASEGIAIMLWPTSDRWADGELDYPEGGLGGDAFVFHHKMTPGIEGQSYNLNLGHTWGAWHTYTTTWKPGEYVRYYLDGKLRFTVTKDVPTTAHRYMIQTGNAGKGGHLVIDWVETKPL